MLFYFIEFKLNKDVDSEKRELNQGEVHIFLYPQVKHESFLVKSCQNLGKCHTNRNDVYITFNVYRP